MFFRLALPLSNHQDAPEQDLHVVPGQVASPPRADQCRGHPVLCLHASAKALGQRGSKALEFGWQPGLNKRGGFLEAMQWVTGMIGIF